MAGNEGRGYSSNPVRTYKAAADLSSYQYRFMKMNDDNEVTYSGANGKSVGILMNKPDAAGKPAEVYGPGSYAKLKINETISVGDLLTSTSTGLGEQVDAAGEFCGAIALQAGVQNDIIEVMVVAFTAHASDA